MNKRRNEIKFQQKAAHITNDELRTYVIGKALRDGVSEDADFPQYASGFEEVYAMIEEKDELDRLDQYFERIHPEPSGTIYGYVDDKTMEPIALWDRTEAFKFYSHEVLFVSSLIPVNLGFVLCMDDLVNITEETVALFRTEVENMLLHNSFPLFLLKRTPEEYINSYDAWSLRDGEHVNVSNFKSWRKGFTVSYSFSSPAKHSSGCYDIIPPSKKLIWALNLNLLPTEWERLRSVDSWEQRPIVNVTCGIPEEFADVFHRALGLINAGRYTDLGNNEHFALLEDRFFRFVDMVELHAPDYYLQCNMKLIKRSCNIIFKALGLNSL